MRPRSILVFLGMALALLGTSPFSAFAKTRGFCVECHSSERIKGFAFTDDRSIYHAKLDPCPGLRALSEEIFFTESRIIKLDQILKEMDEAGRTRNRLMDEVSKVSDSLHDLKSAEVSSTAKFSQNASSLRASLQKVYDRTLQERDESDRRWLIGVGGLIFLGLLGLIGMGYWKLNRIGKALLLLFISGTLVSCSFGPAEPKKKSLAQEELEQALFVASQATTQMEEAFDQSILLAEMAGEWSKIEPGPAEKAFELAWAMALKARERANRIRTFQKITSQYPDQPEASKREVSFDTVLDLHDELQSGVGRTWALRAIAEEWIRIDERKGRKALEFSTQEVLSTKEETLRDRELKSIAEDWAGIDLVRADQIARSIRDPFLKAITLTHIAERRRDRMGFEEAWRIAEALPPSYSQAKAFIRISTTASKTYPNERERWKKRVSEKIQDLKHPQLRAFASQEMLFQWVPLDRGQSERWISNLSPLFPEIRAYSLIRLAGGKENSKKKSLSLLKEALHEAPKVADPFEAEKIRSLIVKAMVNLDAEEAIRNLSQVEDPFYRSEILGELTKQFSLKDKKRGIEFAEKIPLDLMRMKILVEIVSRSMDHDREKVLQIYRKTLPILSSISDPRTKALTLIQLGRDWKKLEQGREAFLFDSALKAAREIPSPSLRAEVFEALAEEWRNLDRKKSETILNEIDPSVARSRILLEEIRLWSKTDPSEALQWIETLPDAFSLEKATAYQEVARGMRKAEPSLAFDLFKKAMTLTLSFPDQGKRNRSLSPLLKEMVLLNRERTLQQLLQMEDLETRDILLREAGTSLIKEDPLGSMKFIREISEASLRLPLYQKMADEEVKRHPSQKKHDLVLFSHWGIGRLKSKKDELHAIPHYEKALHEMEKVIDLQDRSYLLCALAADWSLIQEDRALKIAENIPADHPEPLSFALLQVGTQLRKWNRKEAPPLFQMGLSEASRIPSPSFRSKRLFQIAKEWQVLDHDKGKEILKMAEKEARKGPDRDGGILYEILLARASPEPSAILAISQQKDPPILRAKILMEVARQLTKNTIEEEIKSLESAYLFAQASKNPTLLGEIGVAWSSLDVKKGLEIIDQAGSREIRLKALRRIAEKSHIDKQQAESLLREASEEALRMDNLKEKIRSLKEIAGDWLSIDQEEAKAVYRLTYRLVEKAAP
jgi:hypothetical protein